ncbi:MAG TPA: hypothetical protein VFZ33_15550 [Chitinophagaceae bacterium]
MINRGTKKNFSNPILWGVFILYTIVAGFTIFHHELWGDEIHSWNIAKASLSFFDLLSNTRYEGHPPIWYVMLWSISKFTHDPVAMQFLNLILSYAIVFIILFYSPFPVIIKALIPFGYFFIFEYSILSRNYAVAILIAFCICIVIHKDLKRKTAVYYVLLFLLSNTHLLSLLLALSFHTYFLFSLKKHSEKNRSIITHLILGILILTPSVNFILPPTDSSLNTNYWLDRWKTIQLLSIVQLPVRAFVPIPLWSEYHFWDTNFLIGTDKLSAFSKWLTLLVSSGLILVIIFLLKKNKESLFFFLFNLLLFVLVSFVIPFTNERHVGFVFIGFLIALWFYTHSGLINKGQKWVIVLLLSLQVIGGLIAITKDIKHPFSNSYRVNELLKKIPSGEKIVTDYWCLNTLSAFTDRSYYCVDLQREASYLLWNSELNSALKKNDRYSSGITAILNKDSVNRVYMISIQRPGKLSQVDNKLNDLFNINIIEKIQGAIEKGSDLYLYEITPK